MKTYIKYGVMALLVMALAASPIVGFAKENGKGQKNGRGNGNVNAAKEEKREKKNVGSSIFSQRDDDDNDEGENDRERSNRSKSETSCLRAYGHLIAPGWIRKNGPISVDSNCWLPFGIANKFRGNHASTTRDWVPPVVSNIVVVTSTSSMQVGWKTNENATDRVYYSTVLPVVPNASSTSFVANTVGTQNHLSTIPGLVPNTAYYLVIESTDTAGNVTTSATFSARTGTTSARTVPGDPAISNIVARMGATTATISWTTDNLTTGKVFYSTTTPLDIGSTTTSSAIGSVVATSHSITIGGLATSTVYYFKVQSADAIGTTATSEQFSGMTSGQ